jgi:hypothetical protein
LDRITPLEFLEEVYSCNDLPLSTRMKAATAAAPFMHPKLQAIAIMPGGDMKERLEAAHRRRLARQVARGEVTLAQLTGPTPTEAELEEARQSPQEPPNPRREGLEQARKRGLQAVMDFIRWPKVRKEGNP